MANSAILQNTKLVLNPWMSYVNDSALEFLHRKFLTGGRIHHTEMVQDLSIEKVIEHLRHVKQKKDDPKALLQTVPVFVFSIMIVWLLELKLDDPNHVATNSAHERLRTLSETRGKEEVDKVDFGPLKDAWNNWAGLGPNMLTYFMQEMTRPPGMMPSSLRGVLLWVETHLNKIIEGAVARESVGLGKAIIAHSSLPPMPADLKHELARLKENVMMLDKQSRIKKGADPDNIEVAGAEKKAQRNSKRAAEDTADSNREKYPACGICNNRHPGGEDNCFKANHPDAPWSETAAKYTELWQPGWGEPSIRPKWRLNIRQPVSAATHFVEYTTPTAQVNAIGGRGNSLAPTGSISIPTSLDKNLINVYIVIRQDAARTSKAAVATDNVAEEMHVDVEAVVGAARVHAAALADSGAIHGSYISTSMSELLRKKGVSMEHKTQRVCSFNKVCTTVSSGYVTLDVVLHNVISNKEEIISIPVQVIPNLAYDMIIGRPQLQKYKLHLKWNLDDIPLETLRGFCTSSDPTLRELCGKGAIDRNTTTTTLLLDNTVCGECQQGRQSIINKSKTDTTRYDCCKYSAYKCAECVNEHKVSQLPKKCTDNCTTCPCDNFLKKITITNNKRQSTKEILQTKALVEASDSSKDIAFENAATELLKTKRSNGVDIKELEQHVQERRRSPRFKATIATMNNETQQIRPKHGQIFTKEELFNLRPQEEGYEYHDPFLDVPLAPWDMDDDEHKFNELPTKLNVSEQNITRLDRILAKYSHVFSTEVSKEPAKGIAPFEIHVDQTKWQQPCNRRPARPQTPKNQEQIKEQLVTRQERNIIQVSQASAWSQVLMVPKPNTEVMRMTLDLRSVNDASTVTSSWPIPNIDTLLQRVMNKKPKLFFKIDLTAGYHQLPVAPESRIFTAFMTVWGIFEWLRVPMGLKSAASWFQQQIATVVLVGLLYSCLELYIDDIIGFADTEEQLINVFEQTLERFDKHNIKVHPRKLEFGVQRIEYVGRILDGATNSISMSDDRKDTVFEIKLPETQKGLKSFLGMTNFFRDYIRGYGHFEHPLQALVNPYHQRKKIAWSPETIKAFEDMKQAVLNSQQLYFLDDIEGAEIILQTDACDYGIGGWIIQRWTRDGVVKIHIIKIFSRSLRGSELAWATNEKEAFAIYFACLIWDYLLRGRKFTIETDHKNLIYISVTVSAKVIKWKLSVAELDFRLRHIDGVSNVVADGASRLCTIGWDEPLDVVNNRWVRRITEVGRVTWTLRERPITGLGDEQILTHTVQGYTASPVKTRKYAHIEECTCIGGPSLTDPVDTLTANQQIAHSEETCAGLLASIHEDVNEVDSSSPPTRVSYLDTSIEERDILNQFVTTYKNEKGIQLATEAECEQFLGAFYQEVVLKDEVRSLFAKFHNCIMGHGGVERTYLLVRSHFEAQKIQLPKYLLKQVEKLVALCALCQKMSRIKIPIMTRNFTLATYLPWDRVSVDTLHVHEDELGYKYAILIIDCFSRFCIAFKAKDANAETAAECLLFAMGFVPAPKQILSDGGPEFANAIVRCLLALTGSEHLMIMPGSHEENSIVERGIQELLRHLTAIVNEMRIRDRWSTILPLANRILNTQIHKATGVAPYQIVYGLSGNLDAQLLYPIEKEFAPFDIEKAGSYMDHMINMQSLVLEVASTTQKSNDLYHLKKSEFNHRTLTEFPINSYVLAHYGNDPNDRPPTKTHTANQGPFLVVDIDSTKTRYTVKDIVYNKLFDLHVTWLRPYLYEEGRTNPIDAALADSNEREIEEVTQHFGDTSSLKKSHLTFTVRYSGQMIADSKRLTWAQLRDTEALHKYLTQNNLRKYLNKRFTYPVGSPEWVAEKNEIQNLKRSSDANLQSKETTKKRRRRNKHKRAAHK
jgi:hypothetical protein